MSQLNYKPEGFVRKITGGLTLAALEKARTEGQILEARVIMCDSDHNLIVDLGGIRGLIPREEAALGIREGEVKDIAVLSRVNKHVCFKVTDLVRCKTLLPGTEEGSDPGFLALLSRRAAQEQALDYMLSFYRKGDVVDAKVTHLESFGAFADIGCGIVGLISIENISVSRISHPRDRFVQGQNNKVVLKDIDYILRRFTLSHKELLGTWQENADRFRIGQTVCGVVRSVEDYGIFVELAPNLAGLAESREGVEPGQQATVYIKNIIPEKMKIKLSLIDCVEGGGRSESRYFIETGHLDRFVYSPPAASRCVETIFT